MKHTQFGNETIEHGGLHLKRETFRIPSRNFACMALGALTFILAGQMSAQAQNRQVRAQPARLTVQTGASGVITNLISVITTNETTPVNLAVDTGNLPVGVTSATLSSNSFLNPGGAATLTVNYDGSVPQEGVNEIGILATGDYTYRLPVPIHSAVIWNGSTNSPNWANSPNWLGGALPSADDNVVFPSAGANDHGTNTFTNVIVSANREVAGLRFSHGPTTNDQTYGFVIDSGSTLAVTGESGFSFLQDSINQPGTMEVAFYGDGTLLVSNANATVALLKEFQQNSILNMSGLDTFISDVDRVGLGDYTLYPYYTTNGYSVQGGSGTNSRPSRFVPQVSLAKTNFFRATHVDPDNYDNPTNRIYALTVSKTENQATGSGTQFSFRFGRTNVFFMDGIVIGAAGAKAESAGRNIFITDTNVIPTNIVPVAYFRNSDGTNRMSIFTIADAAAPGGSGSGTKATLNLSGGRVDALVDRLYLGRDRQECQDNDTAEGTLTISDGVFDVNTAYVSSQELGNNTIDPDDEGDDPSGEVYGVLNVTSNAVFMVNGTLHLGFTTADPGDKRQAETGNGAINVSNGGLVVASNIVVGGITKLSANNRITITSGGQLSVQTEIGQPDKYLNSLSMSDSTITLHVDGSKTTPYVYATNVVTGGNGNTINIALLENVNTFPTQLPLIGYVTASPNFGVTLPVGYHGYIVNNPANQTIDVVILDTPPANLVWNGSPGTTWDTAGANWQGGLTFANGDTARFDDTAVNASVMVNDTIYVGGSGVLVTNNTKPYTMSGTGVIGGTSPLNKWGSSSLTIDVTSELPLTVHEGTVSGNGAVGSTVVNSNGTIDFNGSITRLVSSGTATLASGATVANGVDITGGTFSNSGTVTGVVDVADAEMTVTPSGSVIMRVPSTSTIDGTNATLTLNGVWNNGIPAGPAGTYRIDVLGTLKGTGRIATGTQDISHGSGEAPSYWSRLVIGSGGILSPGAAPGSLAVFTNQSQLDFQPGSTIIIDVDMDSAPGSSPIGNAATGSETAKNSDAIFTSRWSTRTGTLKMNRLGNTPWTNGTVLKILGKPFEFVGGGFRNRPFDGTETQVPAMDPPSPGLGLVWDVTDLATNGVVRITGTATNIPTLVAMPTSGTNMTFSWPASHIGWELQTQVNPLDIGLSTNWGVVSGSGSTNEITITNWLGDEDDRDPEIRVYRLAHPRFE